MQKEKKKILIVSVGGSPKPIVIAINKHNADFVYFICSEDSCGGQNGSWRTVEGRIAQTQCKLCNGIISPETESLVRQTHLRPDQYAIVKVDCDKIYDIYDKVREIITQSLSQKDEVIVDYTGGTKSMTAGCAAAAMENLECKMSMISGERFDMVRVEDGKESFQRICVPNKSFIRRQEFLAQKMFEKREYRAAASILEELCDSGMNENRHRSQMILSRALVDWDNFKWDAAREKLKGYRNNPSIKTLLNQIGLIYSSLSQWENSKKDQANYCMVYDVLFNAERRAAAGYYDDAISRVYRAVEMYAQLSLKYFEPSLDSCDLDIQRLPEELCDKYECWRAKNDGKIKFGLEISYELLADLKHPVGLVWGSKEDKKERKRVLEMMKKRNQSFLAHGITPLKENDWNKVKEVVWTFITKADEEMNLRVALKDFQQLPNDLTKFELNV